MPVEGPPYDLEPNEIRARGDEEFEAIAVSLRVAADGITVRTRTGAVSGGEVEFDYDDLEAVRALEDLSYTLSLRADGTEYSLTNVTPSDEAIAELVEYVRRQMPGRNRAPGASNRAAADGNGTDADPVSAAGELERLADLHERGAISDEEFERKKDELL